MSKDDKKYYMGDPELPKTGAQFEYTPGQVKDLKRAIKNINYFAENFFFIIEPGEGRHLIKLHKCQKKALKMYAKNRYNVTCASRQVGKCFEGDTILKIRNKSTGDINEITAKEFYNHVSITTVAG